MVGSGHRIGQLWTPSSQSEALTKLGRLSWCPIMILLGGGRGDQRGAVGLAAMMSRQSILESRAWRPHPAPPAEAIWSQALALAPATRMWPEL